MSSRESYQLGNDGKAYVDQAVSGAYSQGQKILAAQKNRAFANGAPNATVWAPGAAGSTTVVCAVTLSVRAGGIFYVGFGFSWAQAATGTYRITLNSLFVAAGTVITGGTKIGPGQGGAGNGAFNNNTTAITTTGFGGGLLQYDTGVQTVGTAATAATFEWDGIIMNSITGTASETPFAFSNQVIVTLTLVTTTMAAVAVATGGLTMFMQELAA